MGLCIRRTAKLYKYIIYYFYYEGRQKDEERNEFSKSKLCMKAVVSTESFSELSV